MKAIVVTDQAAGTAGMKLAERPEPSAAINDVVVQIHASGFVPTEMTWPSTWTDRRDRDRTPSIVAYSIWIIGLRAIMRPQLRRPRPESLISFLRPSPISFKNFTPSQERRLVGLVFTFILLGFLGLGLTNGAFD